MAQIDELIAAMMTRHADALILGSDQPAQLNFGGNLAPGAIVPAYMLNAMLAEIVPAAQSRQLYTPGEWSLFYQSPSGLMEVTVSRHQSLQGASLRLVVAPQNHRTNIFTPPQTPAATFQTYQPPVDSRFAPPPAPPAYNAAPIPGYSVPMVTSQNSLQTTSAPQNAPYQNTAYVPAARAPYSPATSPAPTKESIDFFSPRPLIIIALSWILLSVLLPFSIVPPLLLIWAHQHVGFSLVAALFAAFAVLADARALGLRRGLVDGTGDLDAQGWFFATLLLGVMGVPAYLLARPSYKRALEAHSQSKRIKP